MLLWMLLPSGSLIVTLQVCLLGKSITTHQIHLFLGGPITVPQIALFPEGAEIAPLTHLNREGLLTPWTHRSSGGPTMTPLIWLLMQEPKAVKP